MHPRQAGLGCLSTPLSASYTIRRHSTALGERCSGLIRALAQVKANRSIPEIYDTDHELFSHPLDALRYLLVNLADTPPYDPNAVRVFGDGPHRGNDRLGRPAPHSPGQPRIHVRGTELKDRESGLATRIGVSAPLKESDSSLRGAAADRGPRSGP